jgi:dephospho-CoA kinase
VEYREYASFVIDTGINLENTRKQLENKLEEYETL